MVHRDYLIEEYGKLRSEIELHIGETRKLEQHALTAAVAICAWLSSTHVQSKAVAGLELAWWLPTLVVGLSIVKYISVMQRITEIASFIRKRETLLLGEDQVGWESWLVQKQKRHPITTRAQGFTSYFYWVFLFSMMLVFSAANTVLK